MSRTRLTPGEIGRARGRFFVFAVLNVISFTLLSGNLITLYALRLQAGNFLIGTLSSFMYLSYLCLLIGRALAARMTMVGLFGRFWLLRYLMMVPMLFSPLAASAGRRELAYALIVLSVLGFNVARGIASAAYNPILGEVASGKDRGAFLARVQAAQHLVTLLVGVGMAVVLGREAPLSVYALFIVLGIAAGVATVVATRRFPEPSSITAASTGGLWRGLSRAFGRRSFRRFIVAYFVTTLCVYMVGPFLIVYMKQVYNQPDNVVLYFTVFGSLGAVLMALLSGFMIDRLGAKPLFFIFAAVVALVLLPLVVSPSFQLERGILIFAAVLFLFYNMGQFGILNAGQTYFLAAIDSEERLNLGIAYFMTLGLAGGIGSLFGGALLEWIGALWPQEPTRVFRLYFAILGASFLVVFFLVNRMENLGAVPIRDALAVLFSPRDLRAISLLHRLNRTTTVTEEKDTIRALAESRSELSLQEVLSRLRSPRFTIRAEALTTLSSLPLDEAAVQALLSEVKNHAFTTASLAADILGRRGIRQAIPVLRRSLSSRDFFLGGKAMVALAQLGDRESLEPIRSILRKSSNPRLIIHAAQALEIFLAAGAVPDILHKLEGKTRPYLRDELMLSVAGILGLGAWFYPIYVTFLEKSSVAIQMLLDHAAGCSRAERLRRLAEELPRRERGGFAPLAGELLAELGTELPGEARDAFAGALRDGRMLRLERLCFLITAVVVWFSCRPAGKS